MRKEGYGARERKSRMRMSGRECHGRRGRECHGIRGRDECHGIRGRDATENTVAALQRPRQITILFGGMDVTPHEPTSPRCSARGSARLSSTVSSIPHSVPPAPSVSTSCWRRRRCRARRGSPSSRRTPATSTPVTSWPRRTASSPCGRCAPPCSSARCTATPPTRSTSPSRMHSPRRWERFRWTPRASRRSWPPTRCSGATTSRTSRSTAWSCSSPSSCASFPASSIVPLLVGNNRAATAAVLQRALRLTFAEDGDYTVFVVTANMASYLGGKGRGRGKLAHAGVPGTM